jgi:hypothetical protein
MNNTISPFASQRPVTVVPSPLRYTARQWDEVRRAFCSSILADTQLTSLAQNLEGVEWPISGPEETPSSYIELEFAEMRERLALSGQPPVVADQLIDILKETLAFDDPFGEMVIQSEEVAVAENPLVKNLAKLKSPGDFPVRLTALSPETLLFCQLEGIVTLGEFAMAAQRMAGSVIVGGDFRALLNALSHVDERTLARYLPFRPGEKGLHYIEGLAQAVGAQSVEVQAALASRLKQPLPRAVQELAGTVSENDLKVAKAKLGSHAEGLQMYCKDEYQSIMNQIVAGVSPRQFTVVLGDPVLEAIVADILKPVVQRTNFLTRFSNWLRK